MVGGHAQPGDPRLRTASERAVWAALTAQLHPDEILLTSVRFSDPRNGDVEADFIVLMPDLGAAVIEVKGGEVRYDDGEWVTANGGSARRIHPVEQARRAKHALRRYLDRQPEWHGPLLRTEWLLAVPMMDVDGDLGPEARRDLLIDRSDLPTIMDRVRATVGRAASREPLPEGDWAETALTLLMRQIDDGHGYDGAVRPAARGRRRWVGLAAIAVANVAAGLLALWFLGPLGLAAVLLPCIALSGLIWWFVAQRTASARSVLTGVGAAAAGLAVGALVFAVMPRTAPSGAPCDPNYDPCVPVSTDVNCSDLRTRITVTGTDVYRLDRDGDGTACEWFPATQ